MRIIAVDDERPALNILTRAIREAAPKAQLDEFLSAVAALEFARHNPIDVAFVDIKMPEINGIALAQELSKLYPKVNIVFVTGYSEYATDAFDIWASGYLMKPADTEQVTAALKNLRNPVGEDKRIHVQCFGNFEIFVDGQPVYFSRLKSKEIIAYLVDRLGASVSKREIAAIIWEDEEYTRSKQIQLQTLFSVIQSAFGEYGLGDFLIKERGLYAINTEMMTCDYYDYLARVGPGGEKYEGEYMTNYSWAEFTIKR